MLLRDRAYAYVEAVSPVGSEHAATLARAATSALDEVARQPEGRGAALDLLAADALITLALLALAETDPTRLHDFATMVLNTEVARA